MIKTYVKTLPRHQRLIFFIDSTINESQLRSIFEANLNVWGGRYNPVVPVVNNKIDKDWLDIIKFFDPDYIYYSKTIDLKYLESLTLFNPIEYLELSDGPSYHFPGVSSHCLLHADVHNNFRDARTLLHYDGDHTLEILAKQFYRLNFGLRPMFEEEKKWTYPLDVSPITSSTSKEINKIIYTDKPYFKSLLSSLHINSIFLWNNSTWAESRFEMVIYDKNNFLNDHLYFWNRQLYHKPNNVLYQVIVSTEELRELENDEWLPGLLTRLSIDNHIYIVSQSVGDKKLEDIRQSFQSKAGNLRIDIKQTLQFPFPSYNPQFTNDPYFKFQNNLILGKTDFLKFPSVTFEHGNGIDKEPYILDIIIERDIKDEHKEIKFPVTAELHFTVTKATNRVTMSNRACIFTTRDLQGTEFSIPNDMELIRSVLMYRRVQKKLITNPVDYVNESPAGQKLLAFIKLFKEDWSTIKQFLEDKFWLNLFRTSTDVSDSAIPKGKGIFHYLDLESEIEKLFNKYHDQIAERMKKGTEMELSEEFISQIIDREKKRLSYLISMTI
ncbi:MAG: hypothetical protein WDN26_06945 [Chitinophagaceae bacterium]